MEELIGFLVPIIIIVAVIVRAIKAMMQQQPPAGPRQREEWQHVANPEELRRFLRNIGVETQEPPAQPPQAPAPPPRSVRAMAGEEAPAGVVPVAPRRVARAQQPRRRVEPQPQAPRARELAPAFRPLSPAGTRISETRLGAVPLTPSAEHGASALPPADVPVEELLAAEREGASKGRVTGAEVRAAAAADRASRAPGAAGTGQAVAVGELSRTDLRRAIVLSEILSPPLALRR